MQFLGRHDLVGEPDPQRLVGLDLAAGEAQLLGPARADQPGQALRAAPAGDDAEQDLRLPEHRALAGDPVVARQRQLAAAAERVAGDGGDHDARDGRDRVERPVDRGADRRGLVGAAELGDVGAGGEDLLPAGHHDRAGRIGGEGIGGLVQPGQHRADSAFTLPLASVMTATPSARRSSSTPPASAIPPFCLLQRTIIYFFKKKKKSTPTVLSASDDPMRDLKQTVRRVSGRGAVGHTGDR